MKNTRKYIVKKHQREYSLKSLENIKMLQAGKTLKTEKKMRCVHTDVYSRVLYRENNVKNYFCKTCFDSKYLPKKCTQCGRDREIKDFAIVLKNEHSRDHYCDVECYKGFSKGFNEKSDKKINTEKEQNIIKNLIEEKPGITVPKNFYILTDNDFELSGSMLYLAEKNVNICPMLVYTYTVLGEKAIGIFEQLSNEFPNVNIGIFKQNGSKYVHHIPNTSTVKFYSQRNDYSFFLGNHDIETIKRFITEKTEKITDKIINDKEPDTIDNSPENQSDPMTEIPVVNFSDIHKKLFSVCQKGRLDKVKKIFKKWCSYDFLKKYLPTCDDILTVICKEGHTQVLDYIIMKGMNIENDKKDYLLTVASMSGKIYMVKYLVSIGANIHAKGNLAVEYAINNGHTEVVKYLRSKGGFITCIQSGFISSCAKGRLDMVEYLLTEGADLENRWKEAISVAKTNNHTNIVEYLEKTMEERGIFTPPSNYHYLTDDDFILGCGKFQYIGTIFPILILFCDSDRVNGIKSFQQLSKEIPSINIGIFQYNNSKYAKNMSCQFTVKFYENLKKYTLYTGNTVGNDLKPFVLNIIEKMGKTKDENQIPKLHEDIQELDQEDFYWEENGEFGVSDSSEPILVLFYDSDIINWIIVANDLQGIVNTEKIDCDIAVFDIDKCKDSDGIDKILKDMRRKIILEYNWKRLGEHTGYTDAKSLRNFIVKELGQIKPVESPIENEEKTLVPLPTKNKEENNTDFSLKLHEYIFELDTLDFEIEFSVGISVNYTRIYFKEESGNPFPMLVFFYNKRDLINKFTEEQLITLFNTVITDISEKKIQVNVAILDTDEHRFDHVAFSPLEIMFYHDRKDYREYNKQTVNTENVLRFIEDCKKGNDPEKFYDQYITITNGKNGPNDQILAKRGIHSKIYIFDDSYFSLENFGSELNKGKQYICPIVVLFCKDMKYTSLFNNLASEIKNEKININLGIFDISGEKYSHILHNCIVYYTEQKKDPQNMGTMKYTGEMNIFPLKKFVLDISKKRTDMVVGYTEKGNALHVFSHDIPDYISRKNNELMELKFNDFHIGKYDELCLNSTIPVPMIILFYNPDNTNKITIFKEVAKLQRKNDDYPRMGIINVKMGKDTKELNCTRLIRKMCRDIDAKIVYHFNHVHCEMYTDEINVEKINEFINRKMAWETPYKMRKWNSKDNETAAKLYPVK